MLGTSITVPLASTISIVPLAIPAPAPAPAVAALSDYDDTALIIICVILGLAFIATFTACVMMGEEMTLFQKCRPCFAQVDFFLDAVFIENISC